MALNETNNKRQYTQYKRHINDSHERISAQTVNSIQQDVNATQEENTEIKDKAFEERVYTIFNNDLYTNAMFIDYFKNGEFINDNKSQNIKIDDKKSQITLKNSTIDGKFQSIKMYSAYGETIGINDFFLVTSDYVPVGASIKYFLKVESGEKWPIEPNQIKLPLHLMEDNKGGFEVIAEISPNSANESPKINGYAVLYFDSKVEENYGLTNPDLMRFP